MRLVEAEISGYRRFAAKSQMDLDGDLICIVGPNGAGKSSFLDALVHLSTEGNFQGVERTRSEDGGVLAPSLRATYALDDADLEALSGIPEASEAEWFSAFKHDDRGLTYLVEPTPERRLEPRQALGKRLAEFRGSPWLAEADRLEREELDPQPDPLTTTLIDRAIEVVGLEDETLDDAQTATLTDARGRLEDIADRTHLSQAEDLPRKYQRLQDDLHKLFEHESVRHPHLRAIDELRKRQPRFMKFDRESRELQASYDLNGEPDQPIENLLALAGSSWDQMVTVIQGGDKGRKNVLLEDLNERLEAEFTKAWGQTPLTVMLDIDANILTVLMSMQAKDYIEIDQHSDGLRIFVALRAFVALQANQPAPIILVDEAETHLHYDAQADLVTVFEEQDEAAAIIYTTHSAGCLPRDLGVGLRAIVPIYTEVGGRIVMTDHSEILNGLWFDEKGFSPLLLAMGASAFAFSAAQKAVVTEGFTDALLLPTLIRQACELERLEYQVVPDFAHAGRQQVLDFDLLAARVAYVADGDPAGSEHAETQLKPGGVLDEQIVFLGGEGSGVTLEDLVDPEVFTEAVNEHIDTGSGGAELTPEVLPATGRMRAVEEWCEAQSTPGEPIAAPSKPDLAKALLRRSRQRLVSEDHRETLQRLDEQFRDILSKATTRLRGTETA